MGKPYWRLFIFWLTLIPGGTVVPYWKDLQPKHIGAR
jgi:hypothetical protein